jgi:hypothetical protein
MSDFILSQAEADTLLAMEKHRQDDQEWKYPSMGGVVSIPLISADKREPFMLDISKGRIDLLKGRYQNRVRQTLILARLDFGSSPHLNPDGARIACPHLHVFREGYGDKWAIPVPRDRFANPEDLWQTLSDFMRYCNITRPPIIKKDLFS